MAGPEDSLANLQAQHPGMVPSMPVEDGPAEATDYDGDDEDAGEIDMRRVRELENICTHLAMKPWVEVQSDERKELEAQTALVCP